MRSFSLWCLSTLSLQQAGAREFRPSSRDEERQFLRFSAAQNKHYTSLNEFDHRMNTWKKNHAKVQQMNQSSGGAQFEDNFTSDLTDAEFAQMFTGAVPEHDELVLEPDEDRLMELGSDDDRLQWFGGKSIDWVSKGKVSPVKNQRGCGACWAFAAVLVQESMQAIEDNKKPVRLSEQQCVDCASNGCIDSPFTDCWKWSRDHGMMKNSDYPYTAREEDCQHDDDKVVSRARKWRRASSPNQAARKLKKGPLAINLDGDCIRNYRSGILTECATNNLNHTVVIVGLEQHKLWTKVEKCSYSWRGRSCKDIWKETTEDVWLIQNSWGTRVHDQGFIRILKEDGVGVAGMNKDMFYLYI